MHTYIYTYIHMYIHIYIYIYTNTYTHINIIYIHAYTKGALAKILTPFRRSRLLREGDE